MRFSFVVRKRKHIFAITKINEGIRNSRGIGSIGILINFILETEKTSHSNGGPRLKTLILAMRLQSER